MIRLTASDLGFVDQCPTYGLFGLLSIYKIQYFARVDKAGVSCLAPPICFGVPPQVTQLRCEPAKVLVQERNTLRGQPG